MSPRGTAGEQLERLLYILPAAARGAVPIADVARALAVDEATVLADLEAATARAYYHPAGSVDKFTISTDGRTVEVHAPHEFNRPVRLTAREAMALGLGLRTLAADAEPERRDEILSLAQRLEAALVVPQMLARDAPIGRRIPVSEQEVEYDAFQFAFDDDGFRGVVADAVELGRVCAIAYLKPGATAPVPRTIAPYRLVYAQGLWYVLAVDVEQDGVRWFRMDRILDAQLEERAAPPPPDDIADHLEAGVPYSARQEVAVTVRYSPRVARWISERTSQPVEPDGSAVIRHRVADPGWIVRHVLQYAGEAVVEEPAEARQWLAGAAARAMDRLRP